MSVHIASSRGDTLIASGNHVRSESASSWRRNASRALMVAAVSGGTLVGTASPAAAHGWISTSAYLDRVSGGVQGDGSVQAQYQHNRMEITAKVQSCSGSCTFSADQNGKLTYTGGGSLSTLSTNTKTCFNAGYSRILGGYACQVFTSVRSSSKPYCWTESTSVVKDSSGNVEYKGSWKSQVGACS